MTSFIGNWPVMTAEDELGLRELLAQLKPYQAIADKAVSLIREMADRPKANGTIGKQLSVVVLQRDVTQHVLARYYSTSVGPKMYVPDEVLGISDTWRHAHADRELWFENKVGPETWVIPKVKPRVPCPCKSGKRYKNCCGSRRKTQRISNTDQQPEARWLRFTGVVRQERPDFNDQQLIEWVKQNWMQFAPMAYGEYVKKGRGAIFINLAEAVIDDEGIYFNPVYVADNSVELKAHGGWPDNKTADLVTTYDPEQVIVLIFERKDRPVSTMFMGTENPDYNPKCLYETSSRHSH